MQGDDEIPIGKFAALLVGLTIVALVVLFIEAWYGWTWFS